MITKKGLEQFEDVLESREENYNRNKKLPRDRLVYDQWLGETERRERKKIDRWNDEIIGKIVKDSTELEDQPLKLLTKSLHGYVGDMKKFQQKQAAK